MLQRRVLRCAVAPIGALHEPLRSGSNRCVPRRCCTTRALPPRTRSPRLWLRRPDRSGTTAGRFVAQFATGRAMAWRLSSSIAVACWRGEREDSARLEMGSSVAHPLSSKPQRHDHNPAWEAHAAPRADCSPGPGLRRLLRGYRTRSLLPETPQDAARGGGRLPTAPNSFHLLGGFRSGRRSMPLGFPQRPCFSAASPRSI